MGEVCLGIRSTALIPLLLQSIGMSCEASQSPSLDVTSSTKRKQDSQLSRGVSYQALTLHKGLISTPWFVDYVQ